jgi:transposase InsO family protein
MPWKTICQKEQRWKFIREFLCHKTSLKALSRRWGISRKTAYKWLRRFKERGRSGLTDRGRVAQRLHNRPPQLWLKRLARWRRRHPTWGAPKLRWALKRRFGEKGLPSESALSRWLKQWGLTRPRRRNAPKGPVVDRPHLTKPKKPNEVWTVDFKGWFRTGDGSRVDPLTVRDLASRYALAVDLLSQQNVQDCRPSFERIFRRHGLPKVIRVDNGSPFGSTGALGLTRLSAWWVKLGIKVEFIAPGHPEQNGSHEQFHRVYKAGTLPRPAHRLRAQQARSQAWRQQYNHHRPHEALAMRVPAELYRKSRRRMPSKTKHWHYAAGWETRLVKGKGMISFHGQGRYIGEAFERERVGLKRTGPGTWQVYFGPLLVGALWECETTGIRAVRYRKSRRRR